MGFFDKIKKGIKGIGKFARKAAPVVGLLPGVGTLAAAGLGFGGGLLGGEGFKGALKGAAAGALGGLVGKIPGVGGFLGKAGGAFSGDGGGGGFGGFLRGVGGFLKDNPSVVMGGISALGNARDATRTQGLENEQLDFARESMVRRRALEDQITSGFGQAPPSFDFGSTFADPSNPFAQQQGGDIVMPQNVSIPSFDPNTLSQGNPRPPITGGGGQPAFDPRLLRRA